MEWHSLIQLILTFLLAFFSIIPEFKVNNARQRQSRTAFHKIILFAKKPFVRIISLIFLIVCLFTSSKIMADISSKEVNDEIEKRDSLRKIQTYHLEKAITDKLTSMGYQYDSIKKELIRIKDSLKVAPTIYFGEKPLLATGFTLDTSKNNVDVLNIEIRMAGANAKSINILTSIAAIVHGSPVLLYNKHKAFANGNSLGKELQQANSPFVINSSSMITHYLIYQKGSYTDMNNRSYVVDKISLVVKRPPYSGDLPFGHIKVVKAFFDKGIKFTLD
ncbi:hypothetical protein [Pedobacter sp. L105]|uniref:hypothetical protein n=1 Tax=Pedobacter sp. L105 TaxID=1641871 RepID=UPI00131E8CDF|nr:hypothetical protein [Pedobacter sp. L105]